MIRTLFIFLLFCNSAFAASVAIMPIEAPDHETEGRRIFQALNAAVVSAGLSNRGKIELNLPEARISFSCFQEEPECMAQVGSILEADQLIWGKLTEADGSWTLTLTRLDVAQSKIVKHIEAFKVPRSRSAVETLERAARAFLTGAPMPTVAPPKSTVTFKSMPAGAEIWLDGAKMGVTPVSMELVFGDYQMRTVLPDYETSKKLLVIDDEKQAVTVAMVPVAKPVNPDGPSSANLWIGVGTGVAAAGFGVVGFSKFLDANEKITQARAITEKSSLRSEDVAEYNTLRDELRPLKTQRTVFLGLAGVSAVVSGFFFYRHFSADDDSVTLMPTTNGMAIGGRF